MPPAPRTSSKPTRAVYQISVTSAKRNPRDSAREISRIAVAPIRQFRSSSRKRRPSSRRRCRSSTDVSSRTAVSASPEEVSPYMVEEIERPSAKFRRQVMIQGPRLPSRRVLRPVPVSQFREDRQCDMRMVVAGEEHEPRLARDAAIGALPHLLDGDGDEGLRGGLREDSEGQTPMVWLKWWG